MKKYVLLLSALLIAGTAHTADFAVGFSRAKVSAKSIVVGAINKSETSIYLEAYQLTSEDIITALLNAKLRGVDVNVLVDRSSQNLGASSKFVAAGVGCAVDTKFRIMHNKVMIIDKKHIQTGSFNYSISADKSNAENALYIRNVPALASSYKDQWDLLMKTTKPCVVTK